MIIASSTLPGEAQGARWFVLASIALNLFFIGTAGALIFRHYTAPPVTISAPIDRSAAGRIERIAATLPAVDAEVMRTEYRTKAPTLDAARNDFENAIDDIRQTFRAEPYNLEATRAATASARVARQRFEELLQDVIASAAAKMSRAGRLKLAEFGPPRTTPAANR
jgi:uncharacterized membrane protein